MRKPLKPGSSQPPQSPSADHETREAAGHLIVIARDAQGGRLPGATVVFSSPGADATNQARRATMSISRRARLAATALLAISPMLFAQQATPTPFQQRVLAAMQGQIRTPEERARDVNRLPVEILSFFRILIYKPGEVDHCAGRLKWCYPHGPHIIAYSIHPEIG